MTKFQKLLLNMIIFYAIPCIIFVAIAFGFAWTVAYLAYLCIGTPIVLYLVRNRK